MKKSLISNIIYTFILITIAVLFGVFLMYVLNINEDSIKKNFFKEYYEISAYTNYNVQDPDYFDFYLLSNRDSSINVMFYDQTTGKEVNKTYNVDGFLEVNESLSDLFSTTASDLDGHIIRVLIKNNDKDEPYKYAFSVLLKEAQRILIVDTNIISYLTADTTYKLVPPRQILYIYNDVNSISWYDPFMYGSATLPNSKIINLIAYEDFNTEDFTYTFLDSSTGEPVVNAKVYVNSFFVGYTDSNGRINIKYHKGYYGYLRVEDKCHYYSSEERFLTDRYVYVENTC